MVKRKLALSHMINITNAHWFRLLESKRIFSKGGKVIIEEHNARQHATELIFLAMRLSFLYRINFHIFKFYVFIF